MYYNIKFYDVIPLNMEVGQQVFDAPSTVLVLSGYLAIILYTINHAQNTVKLAF